MLKKVWSYTVDFCIRFRTIPDSEKRAPHWGVQSRFRVIYICRYVVCRMSVVCQINCVGGITYGPRACSKSFFGMDEKEAEARPLMGTIFLVYS